MRKRRTREQKEKALIRFERTEDIVENTPTDRDKSRFSLSFRTVGASASLGRDSQESLEIGTIKKDFIKTLIVIVLALASEIGVYLILRPVLNLY